MSSASFIDFESIDLAGKTLQKLPKIEFWQRVGRRIVRGKTWTKELREHRAELFDDRLNFMGLGQAKELVYYNSEDYRNEARDFTS